MRADKLNLDIEVFCREGVFFNKLAPGFYLIAHKNGKDVVCLYGIFDANLEKDSGLRIHRGFPKLFRIHFTEAFVSLNILTFLTTFHNIFQELMVGTESCRALPVFNGVGRITQSCQFGKEPFEFRIRGTHQKITVDNGLDSSPISPCGTDELKTVVLGVFHEIARERSLIRGQEVDIRGESC